MCLPRRYDRKIRKVADCDDTVDSEKFKSCYEISDYLKKYKYNGDVNKKHITEIEVFKSGLRISDYELQSLGLIDAIKILKETSLKIIEEILNVS